MRSIYVSKVVWWSVDIVGQRVPQAWASLKPEAEKTSDEDVIYRGFSLLDCATWGSNFWSHTRCRAGFSNDIPKINITSDIRYLKFCMWYWRGSNAQTDSSTFPNLANRKFCRWVSLGNFSCVAFRLVDGFAWSTLVTSSVLGIALPFWCAIANPDGYFGHLFLQRFLQLCTRSFNFLS